MATLVTAQMLSILQDLEESRDKCLTKILARSVVWLTPLF